MSLFTPCAGLLGGSLIGLSASILLLLNGDILGASGTLSGALLHPVKTVQKESLQSWKWTFLAAFLITSNLLSRYRWLSSSFFGPVENVDFIKEVPIPSLLAYTLGGFFAGIGTKLGNGCTTGHGVCGLARLSPRSIAAVMTFLSFSIGTFALLVNPHNAWASQTSFLRTDTAYDQSPMLGTAVTVAAVTWTIAARQLLSRSRGRGDAETKNSNSITLEINWTNSKMLGAIISAVVFATGLAISGMTQTRKVYDFLDLCALCNATRQGEFDPTLAAVLGSAVFFSWLGYQFIPKHDAAKGTTTNGTCRVSAHDAKTARKLKKPICSPTWMIPTDTVIDQQLLVGATLFGFGWGLAGICPGPAMFHAAAGTVEVIIGWLPAFLVGSALGDRVKTTWWFIKKRT